MTHTITIKTQDATDFALLKSLAERLGLQTKTYTETDLSEAEELQVLNRVAGGWEGDESGDELASLLRNARYVATRDVQL